MKNKKEKSKRQTDGGLGETEPDVPGSKIPVDSNAVAEVMESGETNNMPPPDWLEPLEEDCDEGGEEGVESGKSNEQAARKIQNGRGRRGRRRQVEMEEDWLDWPVLGSGWKRKEVFRRSGSSMGKADTYYLSPKGLRLRSKLELAKHVKVDLTNFDYKQGMFADGPVATRQRRKAEGTEDGTRSSLSSSRTSTPEPDATRSQGNVTSTPPTVTQSRVSTPQRPQLIPNPVSAAPENSSPANESFGSPPELTRVSPLPQPSPDKQPSPAHSFKPDTLGFVVSDGKQETGLSHSSLPSSPAPVSQSKTPERDPAFTPMSKGSPDFNLPPAARFVLDPEETLTGRKKHDHLPPLSGCANCGSEYSDMGTGQELLCPTCRIEKKHVSPHIVFRKVGQDKWVLGKAKTKRSLKRKMSPLRKKRHAFKSLRLKARQEQEKVKTGKKKQVIRQESGDDDDDDDDKEFLPDAGGDEEKETRGRQIDRQNPARTDLQGASMTSDKFYRSQPKSRNRRMCGRCKACLQDEDCGKCDFCMDKPKFGGHNKKRQKCRYRQCQVQSRLQAATVRYTKRFGLPDPNAAPPPALRKSGRRAGKRKFKIDPPEEDVPANNDEQKNKWRKPERRLPTEKVRKRRRRTIKNWKFSLEQDEHEEGVEVEKLSIENEGPDELVQDHDVVYNGVSSGFKEPEESYANRYSPDAQNGTVTVVETSGHQPAVVQSVQQIVPQDVLCTLTGLSEGSQVLSNKLSNSVPLQLSEVLSNTGLEVIRVETAMPQLVAPEPKPAPQSPENTPTIVEVYCLADGTEPESARDPGLLELLSSLRRTILPPHWVGVMAKGPLLQLFQCSKLSPMADTVLQIETGFFYQVSVQNQPLLLTHPIYERHPVRLTSVDKVVALLLDLEGLCVCQGYQSFETGPGPLLSARAALCELLIEEAEECCEKCLLPSEA